MTPSELLDVAWSYPLFEALYGRRSRRFGLGMKIPAGPLAYTSRFSAVPLSDEEEAALVFAASGITGHALADLCYTSEGGGAIMAGLVGRAVFERVRELTLRLYAEGSAHARARGIIIADTKFEFGRLPNGDVILIDEILTPDSSRFWPENEYAPGGPQSSFDKQYVRDYLERIRWNKQPPVPSLPDDVVLQTRAKYVEAFRRLTGQELV